MRRRPLLLALPAALLSGAARAAGTLNVYNWSDYVDPAALERFQRETGTAIRYDVYDSLETLEGKLSAGRSGYDIVVPSAEPTFARLVRAGALREVDRARVPNWRNLDAGLMARVAAADPGNRHGAIYLWGTVGLGLRPDRVRALAPDAAPDSLDLLLKPDNARRLAPAGLAVMDSATDVLPSVLRWLGRDPVSTDAADLRAAEQALLAIRPHLRAILGSGALVNMLATGEIAAALTYSGDVIQAAVRARAAGRGIEVAYAAPAAGPHLWFDMMAMPVDGPNPEAAHAFLDFVLRPEVMAGITGAVRYPNAVPASRPLLPEAVRNDPNVYPPDATLAKAFVVGTLPPAAERARSRLWSRFKAGR
ncbi:MAG TPA: extracellular solute-binding protein [Crenalkalicoccus sp.]|nr:extracellular solute-binding protein [Crenalkalicoccus sp.]